jgi:hypothetical protein
MELPNRPSPRFRESAPRGNALPRNIRNDRQDLLIDETADGVLDHLLFVAYTLTARIPAEYTEAKVGQSKRKWTEDVDFELTLEEGRVYRVRGKWNRGDLETPYELVIEEAH